MGKITNFEELNIYLQSLKNNGYDDNGKREYDKTFPCALVFANDKNEIDKPFFPNPEDWKKFWEICKKEYPFHSVAGGNSFNTKESIEYSEKSRFMYTIQNKLHDDNILSGNVLEIGYGFGGVGKYLMNTYKSNYFGIDYVSSNIEDNNFRFKRKKRFYEINISGIPEELKNIKYNFIFSTNVFQHLTQEQRFNYIKESYDCLDNNGILYFDVFEGKTDVELPEYFSTAFFMVHTKVDTEDELINYLKKTGFYSIEKGINKKSINSTTDWVYYKCLKKN